MKKFAICLLMLLAMASVASATTVTPTPTATPTATPTPTPTMTATPTPTTTATPTATPTPGTLAVQTALASGLQPSFVPANTLGDLVGNDAHTLILVQNGGSSPITVTIAAQHASIDVGNYGPVSIPNGGGTVPNGQWEMFGPFAPGSYNNNLGEIAITYSGVTSVNVAAVSVPQN